MLPSREEPYALRLRQQLKRAFDLHRAGKLSQAEDLYRKVLRIQPDYFDALHMLGVAALQNGRSAYAIDLLSRAIRVKSTNAAAHGNLALALTEQGRLADAVISYERQISLQPAQVNPYANLASALGRLGQRDDALRVCDRAVSACPHEAVAYLARACALKDLERYEECLADCETAIRLQPESAIAWDKRGAALRELGRLTDSFASHQKAAALQPDFALAHLHAGMTCLLSGDLERGWPLYEWRTRPGGTVTAKGSENTRWTGAQPLAGATLLLHSEQGFGDTLQFCRYAPLAELQGARVVLVVQACLTRLIRTLSSTVEVIADTEPPPPHDLHCPLMSLPAAFKTTLSNVPAGGPYLFAESGLVDYWRGVLGQEGFKIGIAWQGSQLPIDIGRSFPLAMLREVSLLPGVRLIGLQKNFGREQLDRLPEGMCVEDFGSRIDEGHDGFIDTAAIMQSLDLIITPDTSIAHLAGALGRPTWLALKQIPDWRWLLEREDSPWYPALRLFRQRTRGDWKEVFDRMHAALVTYMAGLELPLVR